MCRKYSDESRTQLHSRRDFGIDSVIKGRAEISNKVKNVKEDLSVIKGESKAL